MLQHEEILKLKRWNTPTIYNGWEQITKHNPAKEGINIEPLTDFMPHMGPMAGFAVTVVIEPGNPEHKKNVNAWNDYRKYMAGVQGPKIVVVQDLDKPAVYGSFWGEVNANIHKALGCTGCITDGSIRDLDEMNNAGFKALARRLSVGHAFATPIKWNCPVEVFGTKINPGQLIHADKHGFLAIPDEDQENLLDAVIFMDNNECNTLIKTGRSGSGKTIGQIVKEMEEATQTFRQNAQKKFNSSTEW